MPDLVLSEVPDEGGVIVADNHFTLIPDWLLEHSAVSDRAVRAWLILMTHARSKEVKTTWLGRKKIAAKCHCSVDSIDRAIKELVEVGALTVEKRQRDDGSYTSNNYTLHTWPRLRRQVTASQRRGGVSRAATRERVLDRESLSKSLSRSSHAMTAGSDADPSADTATSSIPMEWTPNHTHAVLAMSLGVDLAEVVDDFLTTNAAQAEQRANWDATFSAYLRDVAEGRSEQWPRSREVS